MNIFAASNYYRLMLLRYLAIGLFLVVPIVRSRERKNILQLIVFLFAFLLTIFISTYLSWSYAFQAQGRYLFPVVGMIGLLAYFNRRHLNNFYLNLLILCAFLLSVYSFLFVGLSRINL